MGLGIGGDGFGDRVGSVKLERFIRALFLARNAC